MEYAVGPLLALLLGMKFTVYKTKKDLAKAREEQQELLTSLEKKITENNAMISQQTLKLMMPVAKSVQTINGQLGL
jgi:hypothetical protein